VLKLKDFLLKHRKDYINVARYIDYFHITTIDMLHAIQRKLKHYLAMENTIFCSHLSSGIAGMSDRERDQIDQDAQTFIRTCSTAIHSLKDGGMLRY
jgi:hypothetical protein